jgi:hypothetical protein
MMNQFAALPARSGNLKKSQTEGLLQRRYARDQSTIANIKCDDCEDQQQISPTGDLSTGEIVKETRSGINFTSIPISSRTPEIPMVGIDEQFVETPGDGGGTAPFPGPVTGDTDSCAAPFNMTKVSSGALQGGFTMDDYYPDLTGRGYYVHPGTAGPFDTGRRAGSNMQLFGTIPSPCRPELFSLSQSVTRVRTVVNGVTGSTDGQTFDDIAKSGRDASRAPFRRDWLGGGYNISMADPPSIGYASTTNADYDRSFVTSLVGPGGRRSVNWSISVRVRSGRVTRNTIT